MKKYLVYFIIEASSKDKAEELLAENWLEIDPLLEVYVREIGTYGFSEKEQREIFDEIFNAFWDM